MSGCAAPAFVVHRPAEKIIFISRQWARFAQAADDPIGEPGDFGFIQISENILKAPSADRADVCQMHRSTR